jgi:hypothetical protein
MKYQPGKSGNPKGRPKGSKDRRALFRELIEPHKEMLASKAVEMALEGNEAMMKLLLDRMLPAKPKEESLEAPLTLTGTWKEQAEQIILNMLNGEISLTDGGRLISDLKTSCEINQMTEFVKKLEEIEKQVKVIGESQSNTDFKKGEI